MNIMPVTTDAPAARPPLPPGVGQHPLLAEHRRQRKKLESELATLADDRTRLMRERQERFDGQIAALAESPAAGSKNARALHGLDIEIAESNRREQELRAALAELGAQEPQVRDTATAETKRAIRASAMGIVRELVEAFERIEHLSAEIEQLRAHRLVPMPVLPGIVAAGFAGRFKREAAGFLER